MDLKDGKVPGRNHRESGEPWARPRANDRAKRGGASQGRAGGERTRPLLDQQGFASRDFGYERANIFRGSTKRIEAYECAPAGFVQVLLSGHRAAFFPPQNGGPSGSMDVRVERPAQNGNSLTRSWRGQGNANFRRHGGHRPAATYEGNTDHGRADRERCRGAELVAVHVLAAELESARARADVHAVRLGPIEEHGEGGAEGAGVEFMHRKRELFRHRDAQVGGVAFGRHIRRKQRDQAGGAPRSHALGAARESRPDAQRGGSDLGALVIAGEDESAGKAIRVYVAGVEAHSGDLQRMDEIPEVDGGDPPMKEEFLFNAEQAGDARGNIKRAGTP